ncbi:hypothetical protein Tco_0446845 [Tanacetum coccineum]
MTRSTGKRFTKTLDEPEREFRMLKRAVWRLQQNESHVIAGRNLFDVESSSSNNTGANPPTPPKTLHEHSHPNPSSFQNLITLPTEQTGRIVDSRDIWGRLKRACNQISYLETPARKVGLKNPYLICDYCGGSHEADECKQNNPVEQEKGEDGPEWIVKSRFEDELANFILEKKSHTKDIGEVLDQHRKELHEQFSQILSTIRKSKNPEPEAPTFAITTRLKKQKKDDEDEQLLSIFKQIHINLSFLEAMIHMPNGAKESTPKRRRPKELHAAMSYRTSGSQERPS